jgi:protein-S-isoprenylcysteine O-methyltransferase Ste14
MVTMVERYKRPGHLDRQDLAGEYRWGDMGQLFFVLVFIVGTSSDVFFLKLSASWQDVVPWYYRLVVFLPLLAVAMYFSRHAHKKVFEEKRTKLMVIKTDVFARIRHPMYFGYLLMYLSFVILSFSVVALMIFIAVVLFYYFISHYEEQILLEKLGDGYRNYMKTVPMLIPKLRA